MKLRALLALCVILALVAFSCICIAQEESVIMAIKGDPKIMKKGSDAWIRCKQGMGVDTGDRIKTSAGDEAQVSFTDRSNFIKINSNSDVILLLARQSGSIELLNGEALALIKRLPKGSTFEVKTPTGVAGARGTGLGSRTDGDRSAFNSYENSIYVKGIDQSGNVMDDELVVDEGFGTTVDRFEKPERLERLSEGDMDRWNDWKDSLREQTVRDREDTSRGRLDAINGEENASIDRLESQKQDVIQTRDIERIEERSEEKEPKSSPGNTNIYPLD